MSCPFEAWATYVQSVCGRCRRLVRGSGAGAAQTGAAATAPAPAPARTVRCVLVMTRSSPEALCSKATCATRSLHNTTVLVTVKVMCTALAE